MLASLSTGACWLLTSSCLNVKACHCSFQIAYIIFLSSSSHDREWLFSNLANTVTYLVFKAILSLCRLRPCCSLTAHLCPLILSQHLIMNYSTLGLQLMCAIKRQEYNTQWACVTLETNKSWWFSWNETSESSFNVRSARLCTFLHQEVKELLFIAFQYSSALQVYNTY